jgi:hypothetical protein
MGESENYRVKYFLARLGTDKNRRAKMEQEKRCLFMNSNVTNVKKSLSN